jgi:hypothetical protein
MNELPEFYPFILVVKVYADIIHGHMLDQIIDNNGYSPARCDLHSPYTGGMFSKKNNILKGFVVLQSNISLSPSDLKIY